MPEAARTLVKSPPELWAEVSDPAALARHLGAFGEIRITRLDPESTVAWEGERASGTVDLEPTGWGTKVTVRADEAAPEEPVAVQEPEPPVVEAVPEPVEDEESPTTELAAAQARVSFWARIFRRRPKEREAPVEEAVVEPEAHVAEADPQPEPESEPEPIDAANVLDEMLATLGSARHRPFSRG